MTIDYKDCLTNEQLLKRFKNQFDLVLYAIDIATREIQAGREAVGFVESDNVAYQTLSDIAEGVEILREIPVAETVFDVKKNDRDEKREEKKEKKPKARSLR